MEGDVRSVALVRFVVPESLELMRRRHELVEARRALVEREQALGELRAGLVSFEGRYMRQVGVLYRRLDGWEEKLAELRSGGVEAGAVEAEEDANEYAVEHESPRVDEGRLKAVFRELVKLLHPDFARDAEDEGRRTRSMALANEAYRRGDRAALERMLSGYAPVAAVRSAEAMREEVVRLMAMLFQVRQDLEEVARQTRELRESDSAKLRERAIAAAREGRDLLAEMAARVNGAIGLAMRRYELELSRRKRPGRGMAVEELVTAEAAE